MKYLLVLLVIVIAVGIWRNNRRAERGTEAAPPPPPPTPKPSRMLSCAHCGLHLPAADAVQGRDGAYCGAEHRRLAED